jgi:hypothetical protein
MPPPMTRHGPGTSCVLENVFERMPCLTEAGIHTIINGRLPTRPTVCRWSDAFRLRNAWCIVGLRAGLGRGVVTAGCWHRRSCTARPATTPGVSIRAVRRLCLARLHRAKALRTTGTSSGSTCRTSTDRRAGPADNTTDTGAGDAEPSSRRERLGARRLFQTVVRFFRHPQLPLAGTRATDCAEVEAVCSRVESWK